MIKNRREFKEITKIKGISRTANLSKKSPVDTRNSFTNRISNTDENVKFSFKADSEGDELSKQYPKNFKYINCVIKKAAFLLFNTKQIQILPYLTEQKQERIWILREFFSPWEIDAKDYGEKVGAYYLTGYRKWSIK